MRRVSSGLGDAWARDKRSVVLEEGLIVLLSLDEGFFEEVGVYIIVSTVILTRCLVPTLAVTKTDGQGLRLWLTLRDIGCDVPDPRSIAAHIGRQFHIWRNCNHLVSTSVPWLVMLKGTIYHSGWRRP